MAQKSIGQIILNGSSVDKVGKNLLNNEIINVVQLSIYALPGCAIYLDKTNQHENKIIIGQTGLFQIDDLPLEAGIKNIQVDLNTINLLHAASSQMVIDYVSIKQ